MDFVVGTFNHSALYTCRFTPPTQTSSIATVNVLRNNPAVGGHSWLALSKDKKNLYCTVWHKTSPSVAAYSIEDSGHELHFISSKHVKNLSGYVCVSDTHIYSVGGATGEVFAVDADKGVGELVQELDFVTGETNMSEKRGAVPHGDFGGLRHGAHSCDLSIDGKSLYVADIGRNCIWAYRINSPDSSKDPERSSGGTETSKTQHLQLGTKHISPRSHDGPRHTWPHPNGSILYSLQEHSSMVDIFAIAPDGVTLTHIQGVSIIPADKDCKSYWADEVRLSTGLDSKNPRYMYASTRGLKAETKGYVTVFALREDGTVASGQALDIWETPTSGGIANAIEPAPWRGSNGGNGDEYLAMTDSEEGWVFVLGFDGKRIKEVSRANLGKTEEGVVVQAATVVWL